jgi:hypothetical protein
LKTPDPTFPKTFSGLLSATENESWNPGNLAIWEIKTGKTIP